MQFYVYFINNAYSSASIDCLDHCYEDNAMWGKSQGETKCSDQKVTTTTDYSQINFFAQPNLFEGFATDFQYVREPFYCERTGTTFIGTLNVPRGSKNVQTATLIRNPNSDMRNFQLVKFSGWSWITNIIELYTGSLVASFLRYVQGTNAYTELRFSIDDGLTWSTVSKTSNVKWPAVMFTLNPTSKPDHVLGIARYKDNYRYHRAIHSYDGGLTFTKELTVVYGGSNGAMGWCGGFVESEITPGKIFVSCHGHYLQHGKPGLGIHKSLDYGESWAPMSTFLNKPSSIKKTFILMDLS